jgi:multisubunit Na+/H+ antiporter MnhF subunit
MAYPSGVEGYYPAEQTGAYGSYSQWSPDPETGANLTHRRLTIAVVLLGLCSYLVSFGPMLNMAGIDWDVRFAVLAGLLAALGLLPRQTPALKIVAALAALGFLDALSRVIVRAEGIEPGWALWVLVVLNALQTGVAIGALLTQPDASDEQQAWYAAYAEQYAQAAAQYYGQDAQEDQADTAYQGGTAHAQQAQHVSAPETRRAAAPQDASYAEFVGDQPTAPASGQIAGAQIAQPSAGLPNVGHSAAPPQQTVVSEPEYRTSN